MNNVLITIGVLIVAVLSALFAIPQFIDWNSYRGIVEEEASRIVGRDVRIGGDITLQLLPAPSFVIQKLRVADAATGSGEPLFRAERVDARLSIVPLVRGVLEANRIELVKPVLRFVVDDKGQGNWRSLTDAHGKLPFTPSNVALQSVTITQVLKQAGYTTGIFGKWHLGDAAPYQPGKRGFDEVFIHGCGGIGQHYPGTCSDAPGNKYFDPTILHNNMFEKTKGYCTDVFFDQSVRWMEKVRKGGKPFFTYITPNAPHAPLDCPEEYAAMYKDKGLPEMTVKFYGMITNIDDNVGRLMAKLKEWDIERETLLIFMNDNGGTAGVRVYNAGMRGQKAGPYEGGVRAAGFGIPPYRKQSARR